MGFFPADSGQGRSSPSLRRCWVALALACAARGGGDSGSAARHTRARAEELGRGETLPQGETFVSEDAEDVLEPQGYEFKVSVPADLEAWPGGFRELSYKTVRTRLLQPSSFTVHVQALTSFPIDSFSPRTLFSTMQLTNSY